MNIEEERKAFEADHAKRYPGVCLIIRKGRYWSDYVEAAFQGWLAAKAHAEEMAKRFVIIKRKGLDAEPSSYPWVVVCIEGGVLEDFRSEDDAKEWAESCGYRVASE